MSPAIRVTDYDPGWPRRLGGRALDVEYVGSTSVPGLAAEDWNRTQDYADAKNGIVREILAWRPGPRKPRTIAT